MKPGTSVRVASADDVDEVAACIHGLAEYEQMADEVIWTLDQLRASLFGTHSTTRVLLAIDETSGDVAGMALWYPTFSTFLGKHGIWLEDLFVKPNYRGRGHGLALLHALRAMTDGRVEWNVLDWNQPSIELYESLGAAAVPGWTRYRWLPDDAAPTPDQSLRRQ